MAEFYGDGSKLRDDRERVHRSEDSRHCGGQPPGIPQRENKQTVIARIIHDGLEPIIRAIIVLAILGFAVQQFVLDPPHIFESVEVLTPTVAAGQSVSLLYVRHKKKNCTATIHQFVVQESTGEAVLRQVIPGGYGPFGVAPVRVRLATLPDWEPGAYVYQPTMRQECGWLDFTVTIPPARFEIVK